MIKLFACDLDGTLLNRAHETDEIILDAIEEVGRCGCFFAVSTGRHMHKEQRVEMGFESRGVYTVCMNGAMVLDKDGTIIYEKTVKPEIIRELIHAFPMIDFEFIGTEHTYMRCSKASYVEQFRQRSIWGKVTRSFKIEQFLADCLFDVSEEALLNEKIYKINFRLSDPVLNQQMREFISAHSDSLTNAPFDSEMFELTDICANKGEAVAFLAKYLGITEEETAVYGDGGNDIEMLSRFTHSYAPRNAIEKARQAASKTIGWNTDHAVAKHIVKTLKKENAA